MEGNARTWFTAKQKSELWQRWKNGQCVADIARALERRNKSGVYRVLAVNGGIAPAPRWRAPVALRLEEREEISRGIVVGWSIRRIAQSLGRSPSTVSREIKRQFPADQGMQISHETIYRTLFIQTRGVLKKRLMTHLRTARQMRQAKGGTTKSGLGQIVNAVSIRERPAEAEDRAVPGHWEGDLLSGANNTHTLQRSSSAILALRCFSRSRARTPRRW